MAVFGKFVLKADFAADIPNSGGKSITLKKGAVVEGIVLTKGGDPNMDGSGPPYAVSTSGDVNGQKLGLQIPIEMLERHKSEGGNVKKSYHWLYLLMAGGLVYWYATRGKKKRPQAAPAGFAGMSGINDVVVYDNGGKSFDRYTVFTPDGSVYGMSENASGFNLYIGEEGEISKGSHLGKKLKSVPAGIRDAVKERMKQ